MSARRFYLKYTMMAGTGWRDVEGAEEALTAYRELLGIGATDIRITDERGQVFAVEELAGMTTRQRPAARL